MGRVLQWKQENRPCFFTEQAERMDTPSPEAMDFLMDSKSFIQATTFKSAALRRCCSKNRSISFLVPEPLSRRMKGSRQKSWKEAPWSWRLKISLIGRGASREDIAFGVVESVVTKVAQMIAQVPGENYFLTGGLCEEAYILERLGVALGKPVTSVPMARFAGALGAAIMAKEQ